MTNYIYYVYVSSVFEAFLTKEYHNQQVIARAMPLQTLCRLLYYDSGLYDLFSVGAKFFVDRAVA